jgi:DNA-binding transcriptional LysR family regulator
MDQAIELRHLRYFVAVAEELHFGRAAKRLHIAQPPLSQQIRRLEELLGYQLLIRTSRAVKLTSSGEALLERARRSLDRIQEDLEYVRRVGRGETGYLRVGFIGSGMLTRLPTLLREYRPKYPNVELRLGEFYTTNLVTAIGDGSVDVGFCGMEDRTRSCRWNRCWKRDLLLLFPNFTGWRIARKFRFMICATKLSFSFRVLPVKRHGIGQ